MPPRYLFGPVTAAYAAEKLHEQRQAGACLAFNPTGDVDLLVTATDDWATVLGRLPAGWQPDFVVVNLGYTSVPGCFWSQPLPLVGLAQDWNLLWHLYRRRLPQCELVLTDTLGVETLHREGIVHARAANLFGCDRSWVERSWPETVRDIDVLFVGNFNPAVQRERLPWFARLARLASRRRIMLTTGVFGDDYRRLLARARIVFNFSIRGECNLRVFESAAAGALLFQESGNREVGDYFRNGQECVFYDDTNLEALLDHYLDHEEKRRAIADAARARIGELTFARLWQQQVEQIEAELPALRERARERMVPNPVESLRTRTWEMLCASLGNDPRLEEDLRAALAREPRAELQHALGMVVGMGATANARLEAAARFAEAKNPSPQPPLRFGEGGGRKTTPLPQPPPRSGEGRKTTPPPRPPPRSGEGEEERPLPPAPSPEAERGRRTTPPPSPPPRSGEEEEDNPSPQPPPRSGEGRKTTLTPNPLPEAERGERKTTPSPRPLPREAERGRKHLEPRFPSWPVRLPAPPLRFGEGGWGDAFSGRGLGGGVAFSGRGPGGGGAFHPHAPLIAAEALADGGPDPQAVEHARQALHHVEHSNDLSPDGLDAAHYPPRFDVFRVEWERAAWENAGRPEAEVAAKRRILLWRLHGVLAEWTGELEHYRKAVRRQQAPICGRASAAAGLRQQGGPDRLPRPPACCARRRRPTRSTPPRRGRLPRRWPMPETAPGWHSWFRNAASSLPPCPCCRGKRGLMARCLPVAQSSRLCLRDAPTCRR